MCSDLFKNSVTYKQFTYKSYMSINKGLALISHQGLVCHKNNVCFSFPMSCGSFGYYYNLLRWMGLRINLPEKGLPRYGTKYLTSSLALQQGPF